jgi:hypothetical protein
VSSYCCRSIVLRHAHLTREAKNGPRVLRQANPPKLLRTGNKPRLINPIELGKFASEALHLFAILGHRRLPTTPAITCRAPLAWLRIVAQSSLTKNHAGRPVVGTSSRSTQ